MSARDTALRVVVAAMDTGTRCERCRASIRQGEEFAIEPRWNGFDHIHVECPVTEHSPDPARRVVQGATRRHA